MQQVNFQVKATISIRKLHQNLWYMTCNKCNTSTGVKYNEAFTCMYCKKEEIVVEPYMYITSLKM